MYNSTDIEVTPDYDTVVGKVIDTGEHLIVSKLNDSNGFHARLGETTGFESRNILCVPIKSVTAGDVASGDRCFYVIRNHRIHHFPVLIT